MSAMTKAIGAMSAMPLDLADSPWIAQKCCTKLGTFSANQASTTLLRRGCLTPPRVRTDRTDLHGRCMVSLALHAVAGPLRVALHTYTWGRGPGARVDSGDHLGGYYGFPPVSPVFSCLRPVFVV